MDQLIEYPTDKEIQLQRYIQSLHQELQVSHQTKLSLQEALVETNKQGMHVIFEASFKAILRLNMKLMSTYTIHVHDSIHKHFSHLLQIRLMIMKYL